MPNLALAVYFWLAFCCNVHQVDLNFAAAVMRVESGIPGVCEFRTGHLPPHHWGPMNVDDCFRGQPWGWKVEEWHTNIWYGVRALRGKNRRAILQNYNRKCNPAYINAVLRLARQYDRKPTPELALASIYYTKIPLSFR